MFRSLIVSTIATLGLAATAASPARADLLAYYTFEGNANNVAPAHTGSYDGTPINDPALTPGFTGQAYPFDGTNDFISVPLDINPATLPTLTMGAWVKSESRNGIQQILSHDNGGYDRSLGLDARGSSPFAYNFATFAGSAAVLNANLYSTDWTFLATVYDAPHSSVKLYVNGTSHNPGDTNNDGVVDLTYLGSSFSRSPLGRVLFSGSGTPLRPHVRL